MTSCRRPTPDWLHIGASMSARRGGFSGSGRGKHHSRCSPAPPCRPFTAAEIDAEYRFDASPGPDEIVQSQESPPSRSRSRGRRRTRRRRAPARARLRHGVAPRRSHSSRRIARRGSGRDDRYAMIPVVVSPAASGLRVSGVFKARDTESFVRMMSALHGLQVEQDRQAFRLR